MTTVRQILKDYGIKPLKRFGQSFLEDKNVIHKILKISEITGENTVVEIGAGVGIMTELIAKRARKVIALEIDPRMIQILNERLASYHNVDVVQTDVLKYDFSLATSGLTTQKLTIIGNIPYNISSQILFRLLGYRNHISSMILMFQKELAERFIAFPGTKEYGIPTVLLSMYAECSREMLIPRNCFYPEPKIMSTVLRLVIREIPQVDLQNHEFFVKIVKMAFSKRRKTLLNNLRSLHILGFSEKEVANALWNAGIDGTRRGETLTAVELGRLCNTLYTREMP
ncbi:MAG: 16S rRNA (adenine(1518)-N(6)/adenine(1519)-N(6))-dimethyltransferase RsmA [Syntrophaceae bacterium]